MIYQIKKNKKAFTLIEILVSISIVSFVILATTSIFRSTMNSQKKLVMDSAVLNDINYFLKLATDNIRNSEISDGSICGIAADKFFDVQANFIAFIKDGQCHYFEAIDDDGVMRLVMYTDSKGENYITSKKTNITSFNFEVEDFIEFGQPLVTISIKATPVDEPENDVQAQTSVSIDYYE